MTTSYYEAESAAFHLQPKLVMKSPENDSQGNIDMDFSGKWDKSNNSAEIAISFKGNLDVEKENEMLELNLGLVKLDSSLYVKVDQLQLPAELQLLAGPYLSTLDQIKGNWYEIPENFLPAELQAGFEIAESEEETPEMKKIRELTEKTNFFVVKEDHGVENVKGVSTRHLEVELNKENTVEFIREVAKIENQDAEIAVGDFETFLDIFEYNFNLWIGVEDSYVYKATLNLAGTDPQNGAELEVSGDMTMWDFNAQQNIAAPGQSKPFTELIQTISNISLPAVPGAVPNQLPTE